MIVCFRNFFRNKMVNLSAKSVRHFLPEAEIYCFSLYKESESDYNSQEPLLDYITEFKFKTKYINSVNSNQDGAPGETSGYGHPDNGKYFTEGYNLIFNKFKDLNAKVLILAEDHFFTTGKVLSEIVNEDYDIAIASSWDEYGANGSILCINPSKVKHAFPLPETNPLLGNNQCIERLLHLGLTVRIKEKRVYRFKNRKWIDYCGDGIYTNSSKEMIEELTKAGII